MFALKLTLNHQVELVDIVSSKAILEAIKTRAIAKWGEKRWLGNLVREYVQLAQADDPNATYETRRSQIYRVFKIWSCNLDTAIILAAAVECRLQMECKVLVEEFKRVL